MYNIILSERNNIFYLYDGYETCDTFKNNSPDKHKIKDKYNQKLQQKQNQIKIQEKL